MTIYSLLKHDHRTVEHLFQKMEDLYNTKEEKSSHPHEVKKIFFQIKKDLQLHSKAEDITFYDILKKNKNMHEMIAHAEKEHADIEQMLNELHAQADYNEKWFSQVSKLKQIVKHHVEEEENKIFTEAQKILSPEKEKGIAEDFKKNKETFERLNF